jgi:CheY-like chemotaxis protein
LWVNGDFARLTQVFANLLNNAAKYTEPGGRIVLTLEASGSEGILRVIDNGIGIRPESLESIFELFAQADRTLDRAQGGLGVGLTLVQRLVELHAGTVEAFSNGPGHGAQFTVRLPLSARAAVEGLGDGVVAASELDTGLRILVVDDNIDAAQTMAALLRMRGHEAEVVYDGESALRRAHSMAPDVVFLDIGLPGMNGFQVVRELRGRPQTSRAVLIALTGYGQASDRTRSLEAGFDYHLVKPVELQAIEKLLTGLKQAGSFGG